MAIDWDLMFGLTNAIALAGWLALSLLPRRERVLAAVLWAGVAMLCLLYAAMFAGLTGGLLDPGRAAPAPAFAYTVDGLKAAFEARGAIVVAWTHFLAFDLFVGLWIARDADSRGVHRLVQIPFFFATLMAGPIGLLAWLLLRRPLARR
ncbi:ABA4-like family protein [Qipengyuania sediminis]|uniref:ABA4-like family protein n=1 Tax=Qipengyuania sediminis TaxID=1532023 RepID=UPI00105A1F3A|nr:ABA4-like family protein [Qipengyuania sediminis]